MIKFYFDSTDKNERNSTNQTIILSLFSFYLIGFFDLCMFWWYVDVNVYVVLFVFHYLLKSISFSDENVRSNPSFLRPVLCCFRILIGDTNSFITNVKEAAR